MMQPFRHRAPWDRAGLHGGPTRWYTSPVPQHHPRSRRFRVLSPIILGIALYVAVATVAAGITISPTPLAPAAVVAGAVDGDVAPANDPSIDLSTDPQLPQAEAIVADPPFLHGVGEAEPDGAPPLDGLTGYRWPLHRGRLTLPFGPTPWGSRIVDGEPFHDGIDLATICGDRIVAAHDGIVLAAGRHYDDAMGWLGDLTAYYRRLDAKQLWSTLPIVVVIDDGNGYRSIYAHFGKIVVKPGQRVAAGDLIGFEGRTGRASGCHLHYGLYSPYERAAFAIDPTVVKHMKVPRDEIARVDPLLVLPDRGAATTGADSVVR